MSKTVEQENQELRAELTRVLKKWVGKEYKDEDGNEVPPPAAILNVARQHLKDNHAELTPANAKTVDDLNDMASDLPFAAGSSAVN